MTNPNPAITSFAKQAETQRVALQTSLDIAAQEEDNWYYSIYAESMGIEAPPEGYTESMGRKVTPEEYAMAQEFINLPDNIIQSFSLFINVPGGIILSALAGKWYCDIIISDTITGAAFPSSLKDQLYVEETLEDIRAVEAFITKHFIQPRTKEGQND